MIPDLSKSKQVNGRSLCIDYKGRHQHLRLGCWVTPLPQPLLDFLSPFTSITEEFLL